jgi:hypothetical protein
LIFELVVIISAIAAIFGYWRASVLYQEERSDEDNDDERRLMNKSKDFLTYFSTGAVKA